MSQYLNLNIEPELLKLKSKDDEIKYLKYRTEKHDHLKLIMNIIRRNKIA